MTTQAVLVNFWGLGFSVTYVDILEVHSSLQGSKEGMLTSHIQHL
jgi:hypothetical protein